MPAIVKRGLIKISGAVSSMFGSALLGPMFMLLLNYPLGSIGIIHLVLFASALFFTIGALFNFNERLSGKHLVFISSILLFLSGALCITSFVFDSAMSSILRKPEELFEDRFTSNRIHFILRFHFNDVFLKESQCVQNCNSNNIQSWIDQQFRQNQQVRSICLATEEPKRVNNLPIPHRVQQWCNSYYSVLQEFAIILYYTKYIFTGLSAAYLLSFISAVVQAKRQARLLSKTKPKSLSRSKIWV